MVKKLKNKFLRWNKENYLDVRKVKRGLYEIPEWGKFIVLNNKKEGLITLNFNFNLDERELDLLLHEEVDYIVFLFGERFFYSKAIKIYDKEFHEDFFKVKFNDFLYLGKSTYKSKTYFPSIAIHTEYELLNGTQQPELWCKKAKFLNFKGLGIADKNTLAGTLPLQIQAKKSELDFILGETISVAYNYSEEKDNQEKYELLVYVKDDLGWKNLLRINKYINVDHNNFIPEDDLLACSDGLVCVFNKGSILNSKYVSLEEKREIINKYSLFFKNNLYYQIDSVEYEDDKIDLFHLDNIKKYIHNLRPLIPCILINDAYYTDKLNYQAKIGLNKVGGVISDYSKDQYLKTFKDTSKKLKPLFKNEDLYKSIVKEGLRNLKKVFKQCKDFEIETESKKIPRYEFAPKGMNNEDLFFKLIEKGIKKKLNILTKEYKDRIEKECKVILEAGLVDYFLIIWDIIHYAKRNNILVGTGRGSIAGSLVAYLIDIHSLDSIKHDLMFERFLNETRAAMSIPDVDTDFPVASRQRIKRYISKRFGENHVCSIGSYTKLKLKAGLKDFGRIKGLGFGYVNYLTGDIGHQLEYNFNDFMNYAVKSKDLKEFFQRYPDVVYNIKDTLGQARSSSIHASGVIIVPKKDQNGNDMDVFSWLPVRKMDGMIVSEWEGSYLEKSGFLKEDILGLNQLDKFKTTLRLIYKNHKKKIDLDKIPLDTPEVYKYFKKGYNEDVFQFTSVGLKGYSKLVKPDDINDLIAMNALFRPGPMGSNAHIDFAKIKHGKKEPAFDHPVEKKFSEKTFGLYVYQETVMAAVVELAGFTLIESDTFRSAIKHFELKTMLPFKEKFISGCKEKNNINKELANRLWDKIISFSSYGYNKAHAAAYTLIAYYCQWLKTKYPLEFWTASLQHGKDYEIPHRINEIKKVFRKITIRLPDVNNSSKKFTCEKTTNNIYWSLLKIKHVGEKVVEKVLEERKTNGKFKSLQDFIERAKVKNSGINKKTVWVFILSGAFDILEKIRFPKDRIKLLKIWAKLYETEVDKSFFNNSNSFWILKAKELTGLGNLDFQAMLRKQNELELANSYVEPEIFQQIKKERFGTICGELLDLIERKYKKAGENIEYAKVRLICNDELLSIVVWNETWLEYKNILRENKNKLISISGIIKYSNYSNQNELQTCTETKIISIK